MSAFTQKQQHRRYAEMLSAARTIAQLSAERGAELDRPTAFPDKEFRQIAAAGLLAAPLPVAVGGVGLATTSEGILAGLDVLRWLGAGSIAVGRIYEGHINALQLIILFGTAAQMQQAAIDVRQRRLFGVWNTEGAEGVQLEFLAQGRVRLHGTKIYTSGAGWVDRALVSGTSPDGGWQLMIVPLDLVKVQVDSSRWQPHGVRASASYQVDFTGVELDADQLLGVPGDYYRQPWFSGGAIRFAAVQLGAAAALVDALCAELRHLQRTEDSFQRARTAEAAMLLGSGHLWLNQAGALLHQHPEVFSRELASAGQLSQRIVAHSNLTRSVVAANCERLLNLVEHSIGMRGLLEPHPLERVGRDLRLYLRQPAPDAALVNAGAYLLEQHESALDLWS